MTLFQSLILGVVQGLTEFIPVSSSAHLVLVPWLLGWTFDPAEAFVFDVLVQLGTLVAVVAYFWKDLIFIARSMVTDALNGRPFASTDARLGWFVVLATAPAVLLGFAFRGFFERVFGSPEATAALLLGTAGLLVFSERLGRRVRDLTTLNGLDAVVVGIAQALSMLPGISRSGATISGGLARGLDRASAARFSFLMSIPVMLGAGAMVAADLLAVPDLGAHLAPILVGFFAAAVVGWLCIHWLLDYLRRRSLYVFAGYCVAASVISILVSFVRG